MNNSNNTNPKNTDWSLRVDGKVALVTGAAGGLGYSFSRCLLEAGATVIVSGRRREALESLKGEFPEYADRIHVVTMDVTDEGSVADAFETMADDIATPDVVVSNAGVATSKKALDLTGSDWDRVIDTNLKGCWLVGTEAARRLSAASRGGTIIMISSILGHRVAGNVAPYAAAKAGVEQLTRALALEWARYGIRVNTLAPGYIETDLNREFFASEPGQKMIRRIPQRRLGQADDLSGPLLLLASGLSQYMTGSTLVVDGGHLQSSL
ncbi:SDR family NAD(P)-dependent oxidoreductase [Marinobacter alexandrii]|uniref:SDR family NAD(P)-dependent oxidoreductase n=1 Tax=Marinobacter alexandrii TaxID=2570351 RepID=UPI0020000A75|nr:SDR family NAD(P)-dependent oxidoreductase [Marinobacter alexandrii]MCK2148859.1 SDR family oxidoreductase [Marinobacter alexandrii]